MTSLSSKAQARLSSLSSQLSPPHPQISLHSLESKVFILTGCSSPIGIGLATAHLICQLNARAIIITDIESAYLSEHAASLRLSYPAIDIETATLDAANEEGVRQVCDQALAKWGRLDGFFANAGIVGGPGSLWDIEPERVTEVLRVNVLSVFLALKHASTAMKVTSAAKTSPGGSIVATASVAGLRSGAGPTDYSASKAAVVSLIQTSALQLRGTNIRANAVLPGLVETGMTKPMYDMARARGTEGKIGQLNPLQRSGRAEEVAQVAAFLLGDVSSFVNGQAWVVDGGLSASLPVIPGKIA